MSQLQISRKRYNVEVDLSRILLDMHHNWKQGLIQKHVSAPEPRGTERNEDLPHVLK
jgi:hypothetical protein